MSRKVRDRLLAALRSELLGPSEPDEEITEYPTTRYIVGRLAPARCAENDTDAATDPTENDSFGVGTGGDEDGNEGTTPPLIIGFHPSSMGLSFLLNATVKSLRVLVSWGDYRREKAAKGGTVWRRYQREGVVDGLRIDIPGPLPQIMLTAGGTNPANVVVADVDDPEIALEGVVHDFAGYRAVSIFLVNRRTKGELGDRSKDERWIYQPKLTITADTEEPVFVAKDYRTEPLLADDDGEAAVNALLYRHAREFATGHGVAAGWDEPTEGGRHTTRIFTEFIPSHEIPMLIAPSEHTGGATLDMKAIAKAETPEKLVRMLKPMTDAYESWVVATKKASQASDIQRDAQLRDAAKENLSRCGQCAARICSGLDLLSEDSHAFAAFQFANKVMWDQRIHSIWSTANRKTGEIEGFATDHDKPENRTWRPFQIGFILLNLQGIANEAGPDRQLVDLLWFPTGGGKTEAYLGLSAFALGLRRLRGDRYGMYAGAGVSIIMRYTLRLLTVQQFQRAAALICACELARREDPFKWGSEPFRIGVWVGRGTTPNKYADSQKALEDLANGRKPKEGSPVQLVSCPRCGAGLVTGKGIPVKNTYLVDRAKQRTLIWCPNSSCEFSDSAGLPVVVVDEEIYRTCPALVIATVDKFARLPFEGKTRALFGLRNRFSPTYGHITEAHGESVGGRRLCDATAAPRLLPPDLIIQDELHLISGPLGTMVGLYESVINYATSLMPDGASPVPAKVIASTATIRRAAQQTRQLYARKLAIFPPSGITAKDSFFARERPIDPGKDSAAGRLYVGVTAPGSSTKTLLVRVYSILLAMGEKEVQANAPSADPYATLVGYFNSLRALGGAKRLVEDDVRLARLKYLAHQRELPSRYINDPEELTSRIDSWRIPGLLKKLEKNFPRGKADWPVDVLLATNMISVGVDIDRLGLMVVTGQPKTTAEYIQATSRVGRKYPGLVVTMYNWMGARDQSHYERFESYHAALYRHVEAISVTPFSSRALDRGLCGVFAAMNRLMGPQMAMEHEAVNFDPSSSATQDVINDICQRATLIVGKENSDLVRERLMAHRDDWAHLSEELLRYSWLNDTTRPTNNSRVLLRTAGSQNEGKWQTPGSLREVEPTAAFFLDEGEV